MIASGRLRAAGQVPGDAGRVRRRGPPGYLQPPGTPRSGAGPRHTQLRSRRCTVRAAASKPELARGTLPAVPYHVAEEVRLAEVAEVEEAGAGGGEEPLGGEGLQDTVHGARGAAARQPPALRRPGSLWRHAPGRPAAGHGAPAAQGVAEAAAGSEPSDGTGSAAAGPRSGQLSVPRYRRAGQAAAAARPRPRTENGRWGQGGGGTSLADTPLRQRGGSLSGSPLHGQ